MPVHLDIRPCWTWQCPDCDRAMHYPTTAAMNEHGIMEAARHLRDMHGVIGIGATDSSNWTKDHWPTITACK